LIVDPDWHSLRHTRYGRPVDQVPPDADSQHTLRGKYVYGGPVYHHFGHVMAEMVHRLAPSQAALAERRILFVADRGNKSLTHFENLPFFLREVLSFFSISPDQVLIIERDCIVENLLIFEQGSDFGGGPKPGYLDKLEAMNIALFGKQELPDKRKAKLYVSRSALPGGGGFLGESYVEQVLMERGFEILRPENLTLIEQMRAYRQSCLIVFPEGSACHGTELLGSRALDTVVFISRRQNHLEIFSRVLAPRTNRLLIVPPVHAMGSVLNKWTHNTISFLDFEALFAVLNEHGFLSRTDLDIARYIETCETDFMNHLRHFLAFDEHILDDKSLTDALSLLAAQLRRLSAGSLRHGRPA
jgi:hypothetical protein